MEDKILSYTSLVNAAFLDSLYQEYIDNPQDLPLPWRSFFAGVQLGEKGEFLEKKEEYLVLQLVEAYRKYGHKKALIDPLQTEKVEVPELSLSLFGLSEKEYEMLVPTFGLLKESRAPLLSLIEALEKQFCSGIGFEVPELFGKENRFERSFTNEEKIAVLSQLIYAEEFEIFLHKKYPGQMRFSLEGAESLIPMLKALLEEGGKNGVRQIFIGMAHRGRLNVLGNILEKPYGDIFSEFEEEKQVEESGDVKYHKGFRNNLQISDEKNIEIFLPANPSHLESICPVMEGMVRAMQDQSDRKTVLPVLLHGDASLAGQGVVYETLQMSKLKGYETGGTIHIVINNQIGYTATAKEGRSTPYCTDIAKCFQFPVFHVNAENPIDCVSAIFFAIQLRQMFHTDVFIDLNCYRKYGHNEGDEPRFTQPKEYEIITNKKSIATIFQEKLLLEKVVTQADIVAIREKYIEKLNQAFVDRKPNTTTPPAGKMAQVPLITEGKLMHIAEKIGTIPENFSIHPKLSKLLEQRKSEKIDWATAELLAYGSLLSEGISIRLSGQDVARGTFSHRHAQFIDQVNGNIYTPLVALNEGSGNFSIYNSLLSEFAVMGFDLGYSYTAKHSLVIWEAQFGDFANGAQIIIDQYLASGEKKWGMHTNLTLLLPHGYDGKGPEHSSARIERFLQLSGDNNWVIASCTTPAQFFFLLRKQGHISIRKPLIVFVSKALLRHPLCVSTRSELSTGEFKPVLEEMDPNFTATRLVLCTGKIFYDLVEEKNKRNEKNLAIIRIEQLYPFPKKEVVSFLEKYEKKEKILWVQEEPKNMGAWNYIAALWEEEKVSSQPLSYIGRKASASPATGSYAWHKKQQKEIIDQVWSLL